MIELVVIDVDGTLIENSVENHFRAYILSKYKIKKRHYFLGAVSTIINYILNRLLLPSKFLTFQLIANQNDITEYLTINKDTYKSFINYDVIETIKINLTRNQEKEILLLTGSSELIVEKLIMPLLTAEMSEKSYNVVRIAVAGSNFKPGSFIKQKSYLGFSKLEYILRNYPRNKYSYSLAVGNEIGDTLQKILFKKFIKVQ